MIRAFLFDLGNVLVRFDHMAAARRIVGGTGASANDLVRLFFDSPLIVAHDEGRITAEELYEGLRAQIGLRLPFGRFLEAWNGIFTEDKQMTALLESLLQRYPCYLISNTNRAHFEDLRRRCPVLGRMSGWILSYEVGHLKPHPAIYRRALEQARLPASEILYVDDREDLIEAGRLLGFQAHRFTGYERLAEDLRARGLNGRPAPGTD